MSSSQEAVRQISERHGTPSKRQIGRVFVIIKHNYLMGFTRDDILESLHKRFSRGESQQIYDTMPFFEEKNKQNARTISVMGISEDRWAVRFTEIIMTDRKTRLKQFSFGNMSTSLRCCLFSSSPTGSTEKHS